MRVTSTFRVVRRPPFLQVAKSAAATVIAWLLAEWLVEGPPPVFAAIAALLVVQPSLNQSFARAVERSIGVVAGVALASALGIAFGSSTWVILLSAVVGLLTAWALRLTPGTANQVAISGVLVLALGTATPGYAVDRVLETLLGAAVGLIVNVVIVPPVAIGPARAAVDALSDGLADALRRLADALDTATAPAGLDDLLARARGLRPQRDATEGAIDAATESLMLNPRGGRHREELDGLRRRLDVYTPMVTQVIGMTRAVCDRHTPGVVDDPAVRAIAEQLRRAAHDVDRTHATDGPLDEREAAALTAPLTIVRPSPENWVLVGALLEDLHRIHRTLADDL